MEGVPPHEGAESDPYAWRPREGWRSSSPNVPLEVAWDRFYGVLAEAWLQMAEERRVPEWHWDDECVTAARGAEEPAAAGAMRWIRKLLLYQATEGQYVKDPQPPVFVSGNDLEAARTRCIEGDMELVVRGAYDDWSRRRKALQR